MQNNTQTTTAVEATVVKNFSFFSSIRRNFEVKRFFQVGFENVLKYSQELENFLQTNKIDYENVQDAYARFEYYDLATA